MQHGRLRYIEDPRQCSNQVQLKTCLTVTVIKLHCHQRYDAQMLSNCTFYMDHWPPEAIEKFAFSSVITFGENIYDELNETNAVKVGTSVRRRWFRWTVSGRVEHHLLFTWEKCWIIHYLDSFRNDLKMSMDFNVSPVIRYHPDNWNQSNQRKQRSHRGSVPVASYRSFRNVPSCVYIRPIEGSLDQLAANNNFLEDSWISITNRHKL